tara:strand:+ start:4649 stop:6568 length:1920 start_codon:yes stop_codon:yes gene_type:complete
MNKAKLEIEFSDTVQSVLGFNPGILTLEYDVPYERDDDFLLRYSERDPYSPSYVHEPQLNAYNVPKLLYADVNYEYNYFLNKYESITANIDENTLPSLNYYLLHQVGYMSEELFKDMFYFGSNSLSSAPNSERNFLSSQYFEDYASILINADTSNGRTGEEQLQKYVNDNRLEIEYISRGAIRVYADVENKREMFPYFAKIHMTGMPKSQFAGILQEAGLGKMFVDFLIMHRDNLSDEIVGITMTPMSLVSQASVYAYSIFQTHIQQHSGLSYSYEAGEQASTDSCSILENAIRNQLGIARIDDYISERKDSESTETIAYKLEKRRDDGSIINVKYFLNHSDLEDFKMYDTQVSYGKLYRYQIMAINLVFKDQVAYFVESNYYNDYITVLDSPPIQPDINIVTYRGVSDKILIMFNQMIDQKIEKPVLINPSDSPAFQGQWTAQKISPENPILFESDDPTMFEMFRLEERPYSYQDFVNGKYIVVGEENRTSAGYQDMIEPNKTYYYTFRSLDFHQHVSNPTEVYEFRLNKEGETLFPTLRIVDFKPKSPPTQKNISFKKYLKIGLAPSHYQLPESVTSQIQNISQNDKIQIGTNEDDNLLVDTTSTNPRKFKFRIRSKNTGKLIDVNITFKKNGVFIE